MGNCMCKYACFHHSREPRMWACCAQFADQLREPSTLGTLILVDHEKDLEIESRESFLESSDGDDRCSSFHLQVSARTGSHTLHLGLPPEPPHYSGVGIDRDKVDGLPEADLFALERFSKSFEVSTDCWPLCPCEHKHVFLSSKRRSLQDCFDIAALINGADKNAAERIKVSISRTHLRVYAVTWNMNGKKSALQDLVKLASSLDHEQYDMFVVGLQEVPSCDAESLLVGAFGEGHSLVARATLLSLQLFIISRRILRAYFEDVKVDKVGGGGFGGVVRRQKGAVAVSFKFKDAGFLFIASHLSPHENNVEERNSQFQRISQSLFSSRSPSPRLSSCLNASPIADDDTPSCNGSEMPVAISGSLAASSPVAASAVEDADLVVWLGDLNYRIQDHRSLVDALITQNLYKSLWHKDQLSREIERGHVFKGFREGPLSFRPTYKYDVGTDNYDTSPKERVPSWTDRILYKVKAGLIKVDVCDYDAIGCIKSSDHRPVKAVFTLSPW